MSNILQRIADYFLRTYEGDDATAPKMELSVHDLREIANLNVEKCRLQAELKQYKETRWISVEERLPKLCEDVLIVFDNGYVKNEIATGYLMRDGRWITYDGWIHAEVIAWQPIPEYHFPDVTKKIAGAE